MAGILDLPPELVIHVVGYLEDADVFNIRLANKYLESSSLSYFGKRFFRKKGYLITTPSINVLKSIANHTEFRKYVQHVWFNPDCYTFVDPKCAPEEEIDENGEATERVDLLSEDDTKKYEAFMECITDHGQLLAKPKLAEELRNAFSKLPNLAAIGMRRSEDHSPWGWTQLQETIGEDPRVLGHIPSGPKYTLQGPTKLFIAIMNAVAWADVKLQRLYTDIVEIDNILPETLPQETLDRACRSLLYLEFNATKAWVNSSPKANYTTLTNEAEWGEGLLKLFKAVPHLRELGLQIFPDLRQSHLMLPTSRNTGSTWRKAYPYIVFEKLTKQVPFHHLTRLKLEKLTITADLLKAFMEPSKNTLTSLKIRDIRLHGNKIDKKPWSPIFAFLRDSCPNLAYLLFYHLKYDGGGIAFVENPSTPAPYAGTSAGEPNEPPNFNDRFRSPEHTQGSFTKYKDIALEANGREEVIEKLARVAEKHWYRKPILSYEMDEAVWHTDTSDEEW